MQATRDVSSACTQSAPLSDPPQDSRGEPPPYADTSAGSIAPVSMRLLQQARAAASQARATSAQSQAQARSQGSLRDFLVPTHVNISAYSFEDAVARLRARGASAANDRDIQVIAATKIQGNDNIVDAKALAIKLGAAISTRFPVDTLRSTPGPSRKIVLDTSVTVTGDRNKVVSVSGDNAASTTSGGAVASSAGDTTVEQGASSDQVTTEQNTSTENNASAADNDLTISVTAPIETAPSASIRDSPARRPAVKRSAADGPLRRGRGRPRKNARTG